MDEELDAFFEYDVDLVAGYHALDHSPAELVVINEFTLFELSIHGIFFCIFAVFPGELVPAVAAQFGIVVWQTVFAAATGPLLVKSLERLLRHMKAVEQENGTSGKDWVSS